MRAALQTAAAPQIPASPKLCRSRLTFATTENSATVPAFAPALHDQRCRWKHGNNQNGCSQHGICQPLQSFASLLSRSDPRYRWMAISESRRRQTPTRWRPEYTDVLAFRSSPRSSRSIMTRQPFIEPPPTSLAFRSRPAEGPFCFRLACGRHERFFQITSNLAKL